jgi:general bacterial porin, GBP family
MKKLLIASAALAMVAGTAQAQSSVTIYGVLDEGFVNVKTKTSSSTTNATSQIGGTTGSTLGQTSVLGLRGSEDLGGGLSAIFQLEAQLDITNGKVGAATTDAANKQDTMFSRQAYVGLQSTKFGTIKLGRTNDVVDSTEGFANFVQLFDTEAAGANGIGGKNANTTRYDSPVIGGVQVSASYSSDAVHTNSADNSGNAVTTYGVVYKTGALTVGASAGTANVATSTLDGKLSTYYAGYNFGFADVRAQYTVDKEITASSNTDFTRTKTKEVSAGIPLAALGSGVSAIVHYETADVSNQAGAAANADYKQYGVVLAKALSKRTSVQAGYKSKDVDGNGSDVTTYGVGITHTF